MIRKRIVFQGFVQGVGFRYRAHQAAEMFGCTGWVRNEYNGTVTMEIQGKEEAIDRVLQALSEGRFIRITDMETRSIPLEENERSFRPY